MLGVGGGVVPVLCVGMWGYLFVSVYMDVSRCWCVVVVGLTCCIGPACCQACGLVGCWFGLRLDNPWPNAVEGMCRCFYY